MHDTAHALDVPAVNMPVDKSSTSPRAIVSSIRVQFERANQEALLVLSLFLIALAFNYLVASQRMVLAFYMLPTVASAYLYGRRHATLTALASTLLVVAVQMSNLKIFSSGLTATSPMEGVWISLGATRTG